MKQGKGRPRFERSGFSGSVVRRDEKLARMSREVTYSVAAGEAVVLLVLLLLCGIVLFSTSASK